MCVFMCFDLKTVTVYMSKLSVFVSVVCFKCVKRSLCKCVRMCYLSVVNAYLYGHFDQCIA